MLKLTSIKLYLFYFLLTLVESNESPPSWLNANIKSRLPGVKYFAISDGGIALANLIIPATVFTSKSESFLPFATRLYK